MGVKIRRPVTEGKLEPGEESLQVGRGWGSCRLAGRRRTCPPGWQCPPGTGTTVCPRGHSAASEGTPASPARPPRPHPGSLLAQLLPRCCWAGGGSQGIKQPAWLGLWLCCRGRGVSNRWLEESRLEHGGCFVALPEQTPKLEHAVTGETRVWSKRVTAGPMLWGASQVVPSSPSKFPLRVECCPWVFCVSF